MGIARFFLWLKNQFGQDIQELTRDQTFSDISLEIDNFMIDLNGVFHGSTQKIYEYGNNKPKTRLLSKPKKQSSTGGGLKKQIKVFERFIELAKKHNKPLIIHSRFAQKQVLQLVVVLQIL